MSSNNQRRGIGWCGSVLFGLVLFVLVLFGAVCSAQQIASLESSSTAAPLPVSSAGLAAHPIESAPITPEPGSGAAFTSRREPDTSAPKHGSWIGQRGEIGFFTVGNFNSTSYIHLSDSTQVISSNKSSFGGGAEYRRRLSEHNAVGLLYVQNPSDGKLWVSSNSQSTIAYIWPIMRYDLSILATQSFNLKRFSPFVSEGPGVILTNGYETSGWSAGFAFVAGFGADYQVNSHLAARTGLTMMNTKSGCYGDPTCRETWGMAEDLRVGFVYKWGGRGLTSVR